VHTVFLVKPSSITLNEYICRSSCPQQDVVDFCTSKGIVLTAYSPLGSERSPLLGNEVVTRIANKYKVNPANILISLQANKPNVTGTPMPKVFRLYYH
jgi:glycerol 2-dehydrogenase (NADP+)